MEIVDVNDSILFNLEDSLECESFALNQNPIIQNDWTPLTAIEEADYIIREG